MSGGAVIASMAGLFVIGDATFNSLATGAIIVVAVAVLGSITVLPALLVKLGRWVDRPRVPLLWRLNRRIGRGGISSRILAPVIRRPVVALVVSSVAVLLLALPALGMKIHSGNLETLPDAIPEVQTFQRMTEEFPVRGHDGAARGQGRRPATEPQVAEALAGVDRAALDTSYFVESGRDPVRVSEDGTTSVLQLAIPYDESDPKVDRAIESLRTDLAPAALDGLDAEYAVGGGAAESLDFANRQTDRLPHRDRRGAAADAADDGASRSAACRSRWSRPLLNLLSVGVAFGILTLVFQHGWGAGRWTSPARAS